MPRSEFLYGRVTHESKRKMVARTASKAYAYLNIDHPLCAWAAYRGVLVPPPAKQGFISVWHAGVLKAGGNQKILVEQKMESVRKNQFSAYTSRLRGAYCFTDFNSVVEAQSWDGHFSESNLAELDLLDAGSSHNRHDANWYTWALNNPQDALADEEWIRCYWSGTPCPHGTPIWERIVEERIAILGSTLKERAYRRIKAEFPDSLAFLEIARLSAWVGSDFGSICGFLKGTNRIELIYLMNMLDARDANYLTRIRELIESGHPVNRQDLNPHFLNDSFGCSPDLRPYGCSWEIAK